MIALLNRAFYSVHDSKTPLLCGVAGIVANYVFNWFFRSFTPLGIAGTALAYSMSSFVNMSLLVSVFNRKTGIHVIYDNGRYALRALFAAIPSGLAAMAAGALIRPDITSKLSQIVCLAVPLAAGFFLFWYLCMKIRIPEIEIVNNMVFSGFRKVGAMFGRRAAR